MRAIWPIACGMLVGAAACEMVAGIDGRSFAGDAGSSGGAGGQGGQQAVGGSGGQGGSSCGEIGETSCVNANTAARCGAQGKLTQSNCPQGCFDGVCLPPTALALGHNHTCALLHDGTVWCWGSNEDGNLGVGTQQPSGPASVLVSELPGVTTDVVAGFAHTCALQIDGTVWCWGNNTYAETGSFGGGATPMLVLGLPTIKHLGRAKKRHTCAIDDAGLIFCWGDDSHGQLGDGIVDAVSVTPVGVSLANATQVTTGCEFTCALAGGDVYCWGHDDSGRLGIGATSGPVLTPTKIENFPNVVEVSAACTSACARLEDGTVVCWGNRDDNFLGDGNESGNSLVPSAAVEAVSGADQLPGGGWIHGARTDDGSVFIWGRSEYGGAGNGSTALTIVNPATAVGSLNDARLLGIGWHHACAIHDSSERLLCWGMNADGQLGTSSPGDKGLPTPVVWSPG